MKLKVMFIIHNSFGVGGVQKVLNMKANGLADRDFDVVVYSANSQGNLHFDYNNKVKLIEEKIIGKGFSYFLNYKKSVQHFLNLHQPSHVFVLDNGLKGLLIPFFTTKNTKVFYERHGEILVEEKHKKQTFYQKVRNQFLQFIYRKLAKNFEAILVLTDEMAREWNHEKIVVLPNPVRVQINRKPDLAAKTCVFCGRFSQEKGFEHLIHIWKLALIQNPDWNLLIFTNEVKEVNKLIVSIFKQVESSIEVRPFQKDLNDVYPEGSILLATSLSEGFPVTIAEALTFGLPVIAFDCDFGPRKLIANAQNGFLVPILEKDTFVEKLNYLQNDLALRKGMADFQLKNNKIYSLDHYLDQLVYLLNIENL